jgi:hypothetical protein
MNLVYPLHMRGFCRFSGDPHNRPKTDIVVRFREDLMRETAEFIFAWADCSKCGSKHSFCIDKRNVLCGVEKKPLISKETRPLLRIKISDSYSYLHYKTDYQCPYCGKWDFSYGQTPVLCAFCQELLPDILAMIDREEFVSDEEKLDYHREVPA